MLIALRLATVILIDVNVARKKLLHISLCVENILLNKKSCTVNLMIYCHTLKISQMLKSLKPFCLVTTSQRKNLTAEIYHLLLQCKSMSYQQKDSMIKKYSRSSLLVLLSGFLARYLVFFLSSHSLIHHGGAAVYFFYPTTQWYFLLFFNIVFPFKNQIRERTSYKQYLFHVPSFLAIEQCSTLQWLKKCQYVFVFMTK